MQKTNCNNNNNNNNINNNNNNGGIGLLRSLMAGKFPDRISVVLVSKIY